MISALDMEFVYYSREPDVSHDMTVWEETIVSCASNDRFGSVRHCTRCEARDVKASGAGSRYWDQELFKKCEG